MIDRFPNNIGFIYNSKDDEWRLSTFEGYYVLWERPNNKSTWVLSYVDKDDYIYEISRGYDKEVSDSIKSVIRDKKLEEILS